MVRRKSTGNGQDLGRGSYSQRLEARLAKSGRRKQISIEILMEI
jgi:hypothetical protein